VFTPHDNTWDPDVDKKLATNTQLSGTIFTLSEIKRVIKQLNPHKAPGSELITALMIQGMPPEGLQILLHLRNAIARLEYWPAPLKHAKIIMIPKPGKNPIDVASYRPIRLLPVISKILEELLLKRIYAPPDVDAFTSIWIPESTLYYTTMPST
jgi:hypothetical protein